ncbi:hypothetical protein FNF27_02701 [Cafeteria roenbergensis]|uniref:Uncharacterized protein n=1 Tax=Cafeteria roenbergensis TaxID=33653 RepID=A0A5A8EEN1_CAFRO|nr:hypothetical protein FNF27_02701 [Cafeteria roenbergensis]
MFAALRAVTTAGASDHTTLDDSGGDASDAGSAGGQGQAGSSVRRAEGSEDLGAGGEDTGSGGSDAAAEDEESYSHDAFELGTDAPGDAERPRQASGGGGGHARDKVTDGDGASRGSAASSYGPLSEAAPELGAIPGRDSRPAPKDALGSDEESGSMLDGTFDHESGFERADTATRQSPVTGTLPAEMSASGAGRDTLHPRATYPQAGRAAAV